MTQFTPNTVAGSRSSGGSRLNVYTMMLLIALLSLIVACVYVVLRHNALFGNWNPFEILP